MKFTIAALFAAMVWLAVSMETAARITKITAPKEVKVGHTFNVTLHTEKSDKEVSNYFAVAAYGDRSRGKKVVGSGSLVQLDFASHNEINTGDGKILVVMKAPKKVPAHKQSIHLVGLSTYGDDAHAKLDTLSANVTFVEKKSKKPAASPKPKADEPKPKKKHTKAKHHTTKKASSKKD